MMKIEKIGLITLSILLFNGVNAQTKGDKKEQSKEKTNPKDEFAKMDTNRDGSISLDEFMGNDGDKAKAKPKFEKIDKDSDGVISFDEFGAAQNKAKSKNLSDEQKFVLKDKNEDGVLTIEDLSENKEKREKNQIKLKLMDSNGNGEVSKEEYLNYKKEQAARKNAPKPTPEELFRIKDRNRDGAITFEELMKNREDKENAVIKMKRIDSNGDGKVSKDEFIAYETARRAKKNGPKPSPEDRFAKKDKDSDGVITFEETLKVGKDKDKALKKFAKKDANGDEKITLEEFVEWANKKDAKELEKRKKQKEERGAKANSEPKPQFTTPGNR